MLKQLARTVLVAVPLAGMTWASSAQDTSEPVAEERPVLVRTMPVPDPVTTLERQFFGRITAKDTVSLAFDVGGEIAELNAMEGAFVPAGTPLARLDMGPFERRVERAELARAQALRNMTRAQSLAERNAASQVRAEDAQTAYNLADVELRDAKAALEDAQIIAPFDAQIADRIASQHAITEPGQPILRLHDLSELRVQFDLPERLLRAVGDVSTVAFWGHLPGSEAQIPLTFREIRSETGTVGQSYAISLALPADHTHALRPGQTMTIRASMTEAHSAPILPATAIATAPDGTQYVVAVEKGEDGLRAKHVPVSVTAPNGSELAVTGVTPGVEIVSVGAHAVADGARLDRYVGLSRIGS